MPCVRQHCLSSFVRPSHCRWQLGHLGRSSGGDQLRLAARSVPPIPRSSLCPGGEPKNTSEEVARETETPHQLPSRRRPMEQMPGTAAGVRGGERVRNPMRCRLPPHRRQRRHPRVQCSAAALTDRMDTSKEQGQSRTTAPRRGLRALPVHRFCMSIARSKTRRRFFSVWSTSSCWTVRKIFSI